MKKMIMKLTSLLLIFSLSACVTTTNKVEKRSFSSTEIGFDTVIDLIAYTEDEESFDTYVGILKDEFTYYNQIYDKYNDYPGINNIKTINDNAGIAPVQVEEDLMNMILISKDYSEKSNNNFDITLGPILELWHDHREADNNTKPSDEELQSAKACTGWDLVEIDETKSTVYLNKECASLDVGGVAKGYAAELAAITLEKEGLKSGIVNAGGNVRIIGDRPETKYWTIGLETPDMGSIIRDSLLQVQVNGNISFVTSGDYQRGYLVDGVNMHHIIDPLTLQPARYTHSVTVITEDSGLADAISTVLFTTSLQDGLKFIDELKKDGIDLQAIWVFDETQIANLDGFELSMFSDYYVYATEGIRSSIFDPKK